MTDSLVDLKRLALAATPGPWKWDGDVCAYDHEQEAPWLINERGKKVLYGQIDCDNSWSAELIAALSPERVLAMIAVIEAAEAMRELGVEISRRCIEPPYMSEKAAVNEFIGVFDGPLQRTLDAAIDAAREKP